MMVPSVRRTLLTLVVAGGVLFPALASGDNPDDQGFASLTVGLKRIGSPGADVGLLQLSKDWTPIVFGDDNTHVSIRGQTISKPFAGVAARSFGKGRIIATAHAYLYKADKPPFYDNERLGHNAIAWLDSRDTKRICVRRTASRSAETRLVDVLVKTGRYEKKVVEIGQALTVRSLSGCGVLIYELQAEQVPEEEYELIEKFVETGHGLYLWGLGWAWLTYQKKPLDEYPMNKLGKRFGIRFEDGVLGDANNHNTKDGGLVFHHFYQGSPVTSEKKRRSDTPPQETPAPASKRVALVVGNSTYESQGTLQNAVNDADAMAEALEGLDFKVIAKKDLDKDGMENALVEFYRALPKQGVAFFFYAGHGLQVSGDNYLVPVKAKIREEFEVPRQCLAVSDLLRALQQDQGRVNVVVLDCCRDNPFSRGWTRSTAHRGLAAIAKPPEGTLIAFATAPGEVASDGPGRQNSPYSTALVRVLKSRPERGLELLDAFFEVGRTVKQSSGQTPWLHVDSSIPRFPLWQSRTTPGTSPSKP